MSDEQKQAVVEPEDDATVVHEEPTPEQANDELVKNVKKLLGKDSDGEPMETPEPEAQAEENTPSEAEEPQDEKPALSNDLQTRAEKAGIPQDLAERLHQSGQLEETLASFDRALVERIQAKEPEKETPKREEKPPKEPEADLPEVPELDPDIYDEEIVRRDAYHKQRIDALEAQLQMLTEQRVAEFEQRFDSVLEEMGYDINDNEKCQKTFKAYEGLCEAMGVSPLSCDKAIAERAHAAMYPEEVAKKQQKQTVDRLRDAEGKFLTSPKPSGTPPAKNATDEEIHDQLVSNVASYLKKQGVEMSGY